MADLKISQMTPATTPLAGTEVIPAVQGGGNVVVTPTMLKAFMVANSANVYGYVTAYADLPLGTAATDPEVGDLVGVNTTTGVWLIGTQRRMGFYKRVALTGVAATDYGTTPFAGFNPAHIPEGGSTGQVLKKRSNDDYDSEWVTNSTDLWQADGVTTIKPTEAKTVDAAYISGTIYGGLFQP